MLRARTAAPHVLPLLPLVPVLALACGSSADGVESLAADEAPPEARATDAAAPEPEPTVAALPDFSDPAWTRTVSRAGTYTVHWRAEPAPIPRNQDFELRVWVLRDGAPVGEQALLTVNAWMPDHGHGMSRRTAVERLPDGSFRVTGMLLHMRGHWQVFFEVLEGTLAETAEHALDL